jgi:hypothetical protein
MGQEQFIDIPRIIITCFIEEPPEYCPGIRAIVFMHGIKPHNVSLFRVNNYEIPMLIPVVVWENYTVDGQGAPTAKFAVCLSSDSVVMIELAVIPRIITPWLFGDHFE